MKKAFTSGMILFLAMTTMVSCTQENVMLETTPQVKNQDSASSKAPLCLSGRMKKAILPEREPMGASNRSRMQNSTQICKYVSFRKEMKLLPAIP